MGKSDEEQILDNIRRWLKDGATIKATDINKPILERLPDGTWIGGLTVDGNQEVKYDIAAVS